MWRPVSLLLAVTAALLFSHAAAFAGEGAEGGLSGAATDRPFFLEIGAKAFYTDYREKLDPPGKSANSGWLPGVQIGFGCREPEGLFAALYGSYAAGDLEYDGSDQAGTGIYFSNDPQEFWRVEANIGYTFKTGRDTSLTPYLGYGYRRWIRGDTNDPPGNYREVYEWHYLPLGIRAEHILNERWSIGATAAAQIMFMGRLKVALSELDPGYGDIRLTLSDRIGFYGAIPVRCTLTDRWSLIGAPWYEYRPLGGSDLQTLTYYGMAYSLVKEPASKTHQYGFDLGVSYAF